MEEERKPKKKLNKNLMNALLFVLILGATLYGVFHGQDPASLREALRGCRAEWLVLAAVCVVISLLGEGLGEWAVLRSLGMVSGPGLCILSSCVGFFFSAITPSSTGGQPMQVYYMRQRGIPVSVGSMTLLVTAVCYKGVLVVISLGLLIFAPGFLRDSLGNMMFLYYIGVGITTVWTIFLLFVIFRQRTARSILVWIMSILEQMHILKDRESRQASFEVSMDMYADSAAFLRGHPRVMAESLLCLLARRLANYSVAWCVYRGMGLQGTGWLTIALGQAVIGICADMLPLPGGMGITEALFVRVCAASFGALALPGMILSRGVGHYSQLLLCGAASMLALFFAAKGRGEEEEP